MGQAKNDLLRDCCPWVTKIMTNISSCTLLLQKLMHSSHDSSGPWPIVPCTTTRSYAAEAGDGGPPVSLLRWRPSAHRMHARKRTTLLASINLMQC